MNIVMLIGNLGQDPEVKYTGTGVAVANLSLATSKKWKDKEGNPQEETQWHRLVLWERKAEIAQQYLKKGSKIAIRGEIKYRSWDDPETGTKKFYTDIHVLELEMLGSPQGSSPGNAQGRPSRNEEEGGGFNFPPEGGSKEDLPF